VNPGEALAGAAEEAGRAAAEKLRVELDQGRAPHWMR